MYFVILFLLLVPFSCRSSQLSRLFISINEFCESRTETSCYFLVFLFSCFHNNLQFYAELTNCVFPVVFCYMPMHCLLVLVHVVTVQVILKVIGLCVHAPVMFFLSFHRFQIVLSMKIAEKIRLLEHFRLPMMM